MRIGLLGSYGGLNIGDEAILAAILAELRRRRRMDEVIVFSRDPEQTRCVHGGITVVGTRDLSREDVEPRIRDLDLLALGGGGTLYDGEARHYLRDLALARRHDVPTAAIAVGAGPLDDPQDRESVREAVEEMAVVTVRDRVTKRTLEDVGVDRELVLTADPALLLEPEPFSDGMLAAEGLATDRPLVGMSVREPGGAVSHLDEDGYHLLLAHAADYVAHRFGAHVVFVPMERGDIRHAHAVIAHMTAADHATVLRWRYTPAQVLDLVGRLELVVAMRLHMLIFAAIQGVAALPLPYALKVSAFVERVGSHAPAPVEREAAGPLLAALDEAWDLRATRGAAVAAHVEPLRRCAAQGIDLAVRAADGRRPQGG